MTNLRCTKCGTPEGANLGACSMGGYCTFNRDENCDIRHTGNCSECAKSFRAAPVTEGKKGVCRKPEAGEASVVAGQAICANCPEIVVVSTVRKSGWSHQSAFVG